MNRAETIKEWADRFGMLESVLRPDTAGLPAAERKAAFEAFSETGFPTTRHEEWKYTSLLPLLKQGFEPVLMPLPAASKPEADSAYELGFESSRLVFRNGFYQHELSRNLEPEKLEACSLKEAAANSPELVKAHLGRYVSEQDSPLAALNSAFVTDGAFIRVKKGQALSHPVQIVHLAEAGDADRFSQGRALVLVEENAEGILIESCHTSGSHQSWINRVSEMWVAPSARLQYYLIQNDVDRASQINFTHVELHKNSLFKAFTMSLDGRLIRNNLHIRFAEEHGEAHMNGLYLLEGDTHVDNHTLADHAKPNCYSNELYKGVLDGKSTGVFNGKVMVRQDAQKTNAFQSNRNILLSEEATVNTKPQLEIFADDVKCSHGATTGRLDEEAMFYLRSRGLGKANARALLTYAFAAETLEDIGHEGLRKWLETRIQYRLFV